MIEKAKNLIINGKNGLDVQKLLDTFPYYVMLVDETHHVLMCNKKMAPLFGENTADAVGQYCPRAVHGLDHPYEGCPLEYCVDNNLEEAEEVIYDKENEKWYSAGVYDTKVKTRDGKRLYLHYLSDVSEKVEAKKKQKENYKRLQTLFGNTIDAVSSILEIKDPYTHTHQGKVAVLAEAIAKELGLEGKDVKTLKTAALLHDIGKIFVPGSILVKPGKLSTIEFDLIKLHPRHGYEIIEKIQFDEPIEDIILQHHERLDGSGYPQGLEGKQILDKAKILAVADVVEAMTSHRPYRPAFEIDTALEEINKNRDKLYDLRVVDACNSLFKEKGFTF